eukprot:GHVS01005412.1.p1 GENE.GHVS01005412.1~~GHVS01005412.1.p1  ORF type:complete len:133 (+),score=26.84 GHVS01005412.1:168-566(+)
MMESLNAEEKALADLRSKRMEHLRDQQVQGGGRRAEQEERKREEEEKRRSILRTVLSPEAHQRLSRIGLVKPEKSRQLEDLLLQNARMGRLGGPVSEEQLISLLEGMKPADQQPKISIQRRRHFDDDDDDEK